MPLQGRAGEVVRRQPDAVAVARLLAIEELLALVELAEWVLLAVKRGEGQLVEARNRVAGRLDRRKWQRRRKLHRG